MGQLEDRPTFQVDNDMMEGSLCLNDFYIYYFSVKKMMVDLQGFKMNFKVSGVQYHLVIPIMNQIIDKNPYES